MKYSIIVCCYDEEPVIQKTWDRLKQVLPEDSELIFVNDGSKDNTIFKLKEFQEQDKRVKVVDYMPNGGYGHALKEGLKVVQGDYIITMDADLAMDPKDIFSYCEEITDEDLVVFSRFKDVKCEYPLKRRIFSWGYRTMNKILFSTPVNDTQSGFLCFKRTILDEIELKSEGFSILLELIIKHKNKKIVEKGLKFTHSVESGETSVWEHVPKMLKESLRVWKERK